MRTRRAFSYQLIVTTTQPKWREEGTFRQRYTFNIKAENDIDFIKHLEETRHFTTYMMGKLKISNTKVCLYKYENVKNKTRGKRVNEHPNFYELWYKHSTKMIPTPKKRETNEEFLKRVDKVMEVQKEQTERVFKLIGVNEVIVKGYNDFVEIKESK